jgi:hypothetical protein
MNAPARVILRRPDGGNCSLSPAARLAKTIAESDSESNAADISAIAARSVPKAAATNPNATDPLAVMAEAMLGTDAVARSEEAPLENGAAQSNTLPSRPVIVAGIGGTRTRAGVARQQDEEDENLSPAQLIINLVMESGAELFHSPDGEPFLSISGGGYRETRAIGAKRSDFREWLARLYYGDTGNVAPESGITEAAAVLSGRAKFDGPEYAVHVRVAEHDGAIYVDLANNQWQAVKISPEGWSVVGAPPVRFIRFPGMQALPMPVQGGHIDELRPFINIGDDDQWVLAMGFIVAAFRPRGPYPVVFVEGIQGSGKSTTERILRSMVDPSVAATRSLPKNEHDLMISAKCSWLMAFDNVSKIPDWLSDAFCRLSTGGGLSTRRFYHDDSERLFEAARPILIDGIDVNATRGDLLDRGIMLTLPRIDPAARQTEAELWPRIEAVLPGVLGAVFTAVAGALRHLPEVQLDELPRMADFVKWVTAAEPALGWQPGTFMAAYNRNRAAANDLALESLALLPSIESLLTAKGSFTGTATELLEALRQAEVNTHETSTQGWPSDPKGLSSILHRFEPNLRASGIEITFGQTPGSGSRKLWKLSRSAGHPVVPPASHASHASHDSSTSDR